MAENDKIRVAAIGVGSLGRHHARNYAELADESRVELIGICDTNAESAAEIAKAHGCASFADWRELLDKVDVVSIATPTETHCAIACAFLADRSHARRSRQDDRGFHKIGRQTHGRSTRTLQSGDGRASPACNDSVVF
jgi:ornithine cyclodeaminase/alanine dehydrogenase-like protein (mu-crystallin family)